MTRASRPTSKPSRRDLVRRAFAIAVCVVIGEDGQRLDPRQDRKRPQDDSRLSTRPAETNRHCRERALEALGKKQTLGDFVVGADAHDAAAFAEGLRLTDLLTVVEVGP